MAGIDTPMVTQMVAATSDETVGAVAQHKSRTRVGAVLSVDDTVLRGLFSERDSSTRAPSKPMQRAGVQLTSALHSTPALTKNAAL